MTILRSALPLIVVAAGGVCAPAGVASAASPPPVKAPGRVVFSVNGGVVSNDVDGGGAQAAVVLPDGGAVMVGNGGGTHTYAAEIRPDGSLDPSFGSGGIASLPGFNVDQVVREADGSFVVAGSGGSGLSVTQFPPIVLVRLSATGTIDTSFGANGVATLTIQSSCGNCAAVSVLPTGDLVVTGNTGNFPADPIKNPQATGDTRWVVARLTPNGALDPSFGQAGIATLLPAGSLRDGSRDARQR